MTDFTVAFAAITLALIGVTFQASKQGNERRDVVLLGIISGMCGVGTVAFWAW